MIKNIKMGESTYYNQQSQKLKISEKCNKMNGYKRQKYDSNPRNIK